MASGAGATFRSATHAGRLIFVVAPNHRASTWQGRRLGPGCDPGGRWVRGEVAWDVDSDDLPHGEELAAVLSYVAGQEQLIDAGRP
jgi:hypothetical protein